MASCALICCLTASSYFSSLLLLIVGFAQVSVSCLCVDRLDLIHLIFQIIAGVWSVLTGLISISSLWTNSKDPVEVMGRKVFLALNFAIEMAATSFLLIDVAGVKVSLKQYLPTISSSKFLKMQSRDVMYLTASGSLSLFMGMIVWITSFSDFFKNKYSNEELNVEFVSARCDLGNETQKTFLLDQSFIWPRYLSRKGSLYTMKNNRKKVRELNSPEKLKNLLDNKTPNEKADSSSDGNEITTSLHKNKSAVKSKVSSGTKKTTYIRFYDDGDITPAKETLYVNKMDAEKTPVACIKRYSFSPRRKPMKVDSPTAPKYFVGKRTLSSPFSSRASRALGTISETGSLKLLSPNVSSTYHTPSSRRWVSTWSLASSNVSMSNDLYQEMFSSCSSPDVSNCLLND